MSDNNVVNTGPGATIVSAFMANINYRADRSYEKYLILAKQLLNVPINKVIFVDKSIILVDKSISRNSWLDDVFLGVEGLEELILYISLDYTKKNTNIFTV